MERAFNGASHNTISAVALHAGVKPAQARAFLLHLIQTKKLKKNNKFAARLRTKS